MPVRKPKATHGGRRPNAGRKPGARNKATIAREIAVSNAIEETLARLTQDEIQRLTPLEVMTLGMHLLLKAGNLMGAIATAEKLAPFVHPRVSAMEPMTALPADLQPDPPAVGDEPGPDLVIDPGAEPHSLRPADAAS